VWRQDVSELPGEMLRMVGFILPFDFFGMLGFLYESKSKTGILPNA
jgi:hypothetical protein